MPTPFEILITARKDTRAIPQTTAELKDLQSTAEKTGKVFDETGAKSENYGRALSRGIQVASNSLDILAPSLAKIAPGFDSAIRAAQQFGGAMSLAFSFGPWGIAIAAITSGLGLVVSELAKVDQAAAAAAKPYQDLRDTLNSLTESNDKLANAIQKVLGIAPQQAAAMASMARASDDYAKSLAQVVDLEGKRAAAAAGKAAAETSWLPRPTGWGAANAPLGMASRETRAIADAYKDLSYDQAEAARSAFGVYQALGQARSELSALQGVLAVTAESERLWTAENANMAAQTKQTTAEVDKLKAAMDAFTAMQAQTQMGIGGAVAKQFVTEWESAARVPGEMLREQGQKWIDDNQKASDEWAARVKAGAQAVVNKLKEMVGKAITPTEVTEEDIKATKAGKYVDKWDETRRRLEAVTKGTPAEKYGPKFEAQLKELQELGYTAETAAQAFKDFSLFADPKNIKFADMGVIVADVKQQMQSMIGQANLAKTAFQEVWDSMSGPERAQLASALDVDPSNVKEIQKLIAAGADPKAIQSEKITGEIADNIKGIEGTHTAIIDITKSATFDAVLAEILDDLAKIPASADVVVTMTYETAAAPGAPAGPVGGEANAPGPAEHAQHGGSWVIPPGFNENYPIYGSSGERVTVLPADMSDADLDYFIKKNFSMLESLYNANPQYWMGIAASHPGWGKRDWYEFIFGNQWGHFKLSDLGIPPAGGGKPTTSKPGDSYHGPVYNAPVQYSFTVYPRDYESLMRDARAAAAHGA